MVYVLLGCGGFVTGLALETGFVQRRPALKPVLWLVVGGLLAYSLAMASLRGERLPMPPWLSTVGWTAMPAASMLLLYSLFIELPLRQTYLRSAGSRLVTTGTYALVRHPTVLWYGLLLASLLLASRSTLLLAALPFWLGLDILWALVQDRASLPRTYAGYGRYRSATPMLLPNYQSLKACLATLKSANAA